MADYTDLLREDLTVHSSQELSLRVFNDETLYRLRHRPNFMEILEEIFKFDDEQKEVLQDDLNYDELEELGEK